MNERPRNEPLPAARAIVPSAAPRAAKLRFGRLQEIDHKLFLMESFGQGDKSPLNVKRLEEVAAQFSQAYQDLILNHPHTMSAFRKEGGEFNSAAAQRITTERKPASRRRLPAPNADL